MRKVVETRPHPGIAQIAQHEKVRPEKQKQEQSPPRSGQVIKIQAQTKYCGTLSS